MHLKKKYDHQTWNIKGDHTCGNKIVILHNHNIITLRTNMSDKCEMFMNYSKNS